MLFNRILKSQLGTYLTATSSVISDLSGNNLQPVSTRAALVMGPTINAWDLDIQLGYITLYFSDNVNSSFSAYGLRVQSTFSFTNQTITVAFMTKTPVIPTSNPNIFLASLNSRDVNLLKYYGLGLSETRAYLVAPYALSSSTRKGTVIPFLKTIAIPSFAGLGVRQITFDTTPPVCLYFDVDLNAGAISIVFNEPVNPLTFIPQYVTLVSSLQGEYVILSGNRSITIVNVTALYLVFTPVDLVKVHRAFVSGSLDNLYMEPGIISDASGNRYPGNDFDNPILLQSTTRDVSSPFITNFVLDLSERLLTLTFNKQVNLASVKPNYITLSANVSEKLYNFTFSEYSLLLQPTLLTISLNFGLLREDFLRLQRTPLARVQASSLYIQVSSFADIFGNVQSNEKFICSRIVADGTQPQISSFDFTRSAEGSAYIITLHFSDAVSIFSFNCADFILRSSPSDLATEVIRLGSDTCTVVSQTDTDDILIEVSTTLFPKLLGNVPQYTWISTLPPAAIRTRGIYGIVVTAISPSAAIRVGPRVVDFFLDMTLHQLVLLFSTPIQRTVGFVSSDIGIYSTVTELTTNLSPGYQLQGFFPNSPTTDYLGVISLSTSDINYIKYTDVQTFKVLIVNKANFVVDANNVSASPVRVADNIQSSRFNSYTTAPRLLNLTLNMAYSYLVLNFDEPIRVSAVQITNFRLQSSQTSYNISYKLTTATLQYSNQQLTVLLSLADSSAIKLIPLLVKSANSSYFSCTFNTVVDMAGNKMQPILTSRARRIGTYVPDTISPKCESFEVNMNIGTLTLHFDEPVIAATFDPTQITLQSKFYQAQVHLKRITSSY
jgi:hypothetical protein